MVLRARGESVGTIGAFGPDRLAIRDNLADSTPEVAIMDEQSDGPAPLDEPALAADQRWFSPEDMRLLVITFCATVLANLVTVLLVGLAIVLNRVNHSTLEGSLLSTVVFLFVGAGSISMLIRRLRWDRKHGNISPRYMNYMEITLAIITITIVALTWIGFAAGIK